MKKLLKNILPTIMVAPILVIPLLSADITQKSFADFKITNDNNNNPTSVEYNNKKYEIKKKTWGGDEVVHIMQLF